MQAKYSWLLLPPAIALMLFLGPLRAPDQETATDPVTTTGAATPQMPDFVAIASTTIGVLLLGAIGVILYGRMTQRSRPATSDLISVRQTMRLSGRHAVHVVQFDERLLLVGESEGKLNVLDSVRDPQSSRDEETLAQRLDLVLEDEDEGAVPRNLVIPRPEPERTPAAAPAPAPSGKKVVKRVKRRKPVTAGATAETGVGAMDFQALLKLARKGT